jgi:hypothetical protein
MMRALFALPLILLAFPALAERQWLSVEEFEAKVSGRATQIFTQTGEPYGTEYFLPKRRVIWKTGDGRCIAGSWAPSNGMICYRYEGATGGCNKYYSESDKLVSVDFVGGAQTSMAFDLVVVNEAPPTCNE